MTTKTNAFVKSLSAYEIIDGTFGDGIKIQALLGLNFYGGMMAQKALKARADAGPVTDLAADMGIPQIDGMEAEILAPADRAITVCEASAQLLWDMAKATESNRYGVRVAPHGYLAKRITTTLGFIQSSAKYGAARAVQEQQVNLAALPSVAGDAEKKAQAVAVLQRSADARSAERIKTLALELKTEWPVDADGKELNFGAMEKEEIVSRLLYAAQECGIDIVTLTIARSEDQVLAMERGALGELNPKTGAPYPQIPIDAEICAFVARTKEIDPAPAQNTAPEAQQGPAKGRGRGKKAQVA